MASERPPLYKLSTEELERIARTGTEQERHTAKTLLMMRWNAIHNQKALSRP